MPIPTPPSCATKFPQFRANMLDAMCHMQVCGSASRLIGLYETRMHALTVLAAPALAEDDATSVAWPAADDELPEPIPGLWRPVVFGIRAWAAHHLALFDSELVPYGGSFGDLRAALAGVDAFPTASAEEAAKLARAALAANTAVQGLRALMASLHQGTQAETRAGELAIRAAERAWRAEDPRENTGTFFGWEKVRWATYQELFGVAAQCGGLASMAAAALAATREALA